jgi:MYXO-CTERM domain-containing protein
MCSGTLIDGGKCPGDCIASGTCMGGQCVDLVAQSDGYPCQGGGVCIAGQCVPPPPSEGSGAGSGAGGASSGVGGAGGAGGAGAPLLPGESAPVRLHGGGCSAGRGDSAELPFAALLGLLLAARRRRIRARADGGASPCRPPDPGRPR